MGASVVPIDAAAGPDGVGEDDGTLVKRARAGELDAFDALVLRYMQRAYSIALRLMRQREDAEDLVQDAFILALEKLDRFEVGRPFAPWLFRILVNRGLNLRRARSIRATEQMPDDVPEPGDSPGHLLERSELRERLFAAIDALPDQRRMVVELFELEGLDSGRVGEILNMPRGTVRWHLHEARRTLREQLGAFHGRDA